jgi:hypothetical protein
VADPRPEGRPPGWTQVVLVVLAVVGVVIGAAILTQIVPGAAEVLYDTPIAIGVLLVGTGWWLWRISRHRPDAPDR